MATESTQAEPLVNDQPSYLAPGHDFRSVTDKISSIVLSRPTSAVWIACFLINLALLFLLAYAIIYLLAKAALRAVAQRRHVGNHAHVPEQQRDGEIGADREHVPDQGAAKLRP